jgi:phosphoribosylanthranilate isomerase
MVKVKICGIKSIEEVYMVNKHLPDYIGFVFAESKRKVTIETAAKLSESLAEKIGKVGVFVNEAIDDIIKTVKKVNLDVIQLSGDESCEYIEKLKHIMNEDTLHDKVKVWKSFRIKKNGALAEIEKYNVNAYLLDSYVAGSYGGSGEVFDWEKANKIINKYNIIIAGGLNPSNVKELLSLMNPYMLDVSSGVEGAYGKDENKVRDFIYSVRYNSY